MTRTTEEPTTADDRFDFRRLNSQTQDAIMRRVISLYDGSRTRSLCWKTAMAEYRLSVAAPEITERPGTWGTEAVCSCGWTHATNARNGLTHSVNSHRRYHSKKRRADRALVEAQ